MEPRPAASYARSLSFLLSQVGAYSAQAFAQSLRSLDITPRAYGVLSNLAATGGQTQQQLADALGMHRNNMVGLIDALEEAGLVRRHRSPQDRRAFDVRLTAAGSALVDRVDEVIPRVDDELGQGLSDDERQAVIELLVKVADALGLHPGVHPHLAGRPS